MAIRKLDPRDTNARRNIGVKSDPSKVDPLKLKLGKLTARHDPRTLLLATYATPALPAPPVQINVAKDVKGSWGMMDNDQIGDCTCAAAGHIFMECTASAPAKNYTASHSHIAGPHSTAAR